MPRAPLTDDELHAGRRRIVDAALAIVETKGIDALSMRTLGEAVGLTPGALYRYFANRDEVTEAVFGGTPPLAAADQKPAQPPPEYGLAHQQSL